MEAILIVIERSAQSKTPVEVGTDALLGLANDTQKYTSAKTYPVSVCTHNTDGARKGRTTWIGRIEVEHTPPN